MKGWAAASFVTLLVAACGGGVTHPSPPETRQHVTDRFIFHYPATYAGSIAPLAAFVEEQASRVIAELGPGSMRPVHVRFYATRAELADAVRPQVGELPAFATALVTSADQIHLLLAAGEPVQRTGTTVVHEFAHCATLQLNPSSGNNPRWLWETIAVYEARQFIDPRSLIYLTPAPLGLAELNSFENTRIYDIGFILGEFIVDRGGTAALRSLIATRGDTAAVLGLDTRAFEEAFRAFLRSRYGV